MLPRLLSALLLLALAPTVVRAGGLVSAEPDAAALGRAGAAAALPSGAAAVTLNPGALTLGHGLSIEAGITLDHDRTVVTPSGGAKARSSITTATPSIFVAQRIGDHFAVGLGVFAAPSQALAYPDSFSGRFRVLRASFGGIEVAPTLAGRPFAWLSLGFGLRVLFGDLDLERAIGDTRYETRLVTHGSATGIGGSVGVWARLYRDYLTLGAVYKSAIDLDHTGSATSTAPRSSTPLAVDETRATLAMPHVFTLALGSRLPSGTSIDVEARVGLMRELEGFVVTEATSTSRVISRTPLALRELVQLRAGVEQRVLREHLALRLGVGYDLGAARRDLDPAFPDGDRMIVSAGLGYIRADFAIDAGYLAAFSVGDTSRGLGFPADYEQVRHRVGLSLSIRAGTVGPKPKSFD